MTWLFPNSFSFSFSLPGNKSDDPVPDALHPLDIREKDRDRSRKRRRASSLNPDDDELFEQIEQDTERPGKRRKGITDIVLSGALDAALFTTALGYSAFRLWTGATHTPDDVDDIVLDRIKRSTPQKPENKPDPYPTIDLPSSPVTRPTKSRIPRSARSIKIQTKTRNKASAIVGTNSSLGGIDWKGFNFTPTIPPPIEPFAAERFPESDEEDPELSFMASRLQSLIQSGQSALSATPVIDMDEDVDSYVPSFSLTNTPTKPVSNTTSK